MHHISFRGFKVLSPLCSLLTSMLCMFCETSLQLYTVSPFISRFDTHPICIFTFFDFYMCTPVLLPPHPFIYESLLLSHVFECSLKKHPGWSACSSTDRKYEVNGEVQLGCWGKICCGGKHGLLTINLHTPFFFLIYKIHA